MGFIGVFKFPLRFPASQIGGVRNDQQNAYGILFGGEYAIDSSDHDGRARRSDTRDKHRLRTSDESNGTKPAHSVPSSPPSPVPTTNTVPAANNGEVGVYRLDVTMSRSGTATVTLTWPNADFSLQLYVTSGVCADTASLVTGGCTIVGSTRPGSLPGVVTSPVTGGDLNTIWVLNPDPFPQSFRVDVHIE